MKKSTLIIAILLSISVIYAQERITASGDVITKEYNQQPFIAVDIRFVGDVVIHQGPVHKTTVTANENVIQYVHFRVENGKLFVYTDEHLSFYKVKTLLVEIYTPTMEEISTCGADNVRLVKEIGHTVYTRGAGDVTVEKRNEPQLTVINSGAGDCTLQCLKIEGTLELHNKGAGDIKVKSSDPIRQQTLLIDNACAGDISIFGSHVSKTLVVNNIGPGDVSVNLMSIPTEDLILQNQGAGDITIQNILANKVELRNQGAGDMKLMNGKADEMTLVSIGAGTVNTQLLKVTTAHITHASVGYIIATVTGTAYLTDKSELGRVTIHGGGIIVRE